MNTSKTKIKLDKSKVYQAINDMDLTPAKLSIMMGYASDYVSNLFAPSKGGLVPTPTAIAIAHLLEVSVDDISAKNEEPAKTPEPVNNNVDINEVIVAMNKLGNIQMQMLEYLKDIRDSLKGSQYGSREEL